MNARKQLHKAPFCRFSQALVCEQLVRQNIRKSDALQRKAVQKPSYIVLVLGPGDGAGAEQQNSSRTHIRHSVCQNFSLKSSELHFLLMRSTVFDIRFLADDTVAGAGHIRDDHIGCPEALRK